MRGPAWRCIATEACRQGGDRGRVIRRVHEETRPHVQVLSAQRGPPATIVAHAPYRTSGIVPPGRDYRWRIVRELSWVHAESGARQWFLRPSGERRRSRWTMPAAWRVTLSEAFQHLDEVAAYPLMLRALPRQTNQQRGTD